MSDLRARSKPVAILDGKVHVGITPGELEQGRLEAVKRGRRLYSTKEAVARYKASEALRPAIGVYVWPAERIEWERHVEAARTQLSEADWDEAWHEGAAMSMRATVSYALARDTQPESSPT